MTSSLDIAQRAQAVGRVLLELEHAPATALELRCCLRTANPYATAENFEQLLRELADEGLIRRGPGTVRTPSRERGVTVYSLAPRKEGR